MIMQPTQTNIIQCEIPQVKEFYDSKTSEKAIVLLKYKGKWQIYAGDYTGALTESANELIKEKQLDIIIPDKGKFDNLSFEEQHIVQELITFHIADFFKWVSKGHHLTDKQFRAYWEGNMSEEEINSNPHPNFKGRYLGRKKVLGIMHKMAQMKLQQSKETNATGE